MKPIRSAAIAAILLGAPAALAEDFSYVGQMQAVIEGRTYTTDLCDKNDADRCGGCSGRLRIVVPGSNENLHVSCSIYDETGDAVGITINTGFYDGTFTDTAHDDGNYGRRLDMHMTLHANALPPNIVHAETDAGKPLRDPALNFVKLSGEREGVSGTLQIELEVSYENALVPLSAIIPVGASFDLAAPNG